jgi:hypothetical protein
MSMGSIQAESIVVRVSYSWKESMCTTTKQLEGVMFPGQFWLIWYGIYILLIDGMDTHMKQIII